MSVATTLPRVFRAALTALAVVGLCMGSTTPGSAQGVTTSLISGLVIDAAGNPIAGARVSAVHVPSGTPYAGVTRADGRVTIPGMRVGGPYRVTATMIGYHPQTQENIYLTLGQASDVRFTMQELAVQLTEITVQAAPDPVFSWGHTGAATTLAPEALQQLPTINRRVEDFLRLTPQYSGTSFGYSFAGQDNRLNNMTVDGSYFNNSFGLAGQPGDRVNTATTPGVAAISLDAIEQVQVNVSPYDVRQGNFVGAGVNIVTKSGTNDYRGTLYYQTRSENMVGSQAGGSAFDVGTFSFRQIGASLGGPIIKDRLFFFLSYENDAQTAPGTTFRANQGGETVGGSITRVNASTLDSLSTYLLNNFNYTTGPYQGYDFETPSTRFMGRLDYNHNERNKFTLRYTLLNSNSDILISNSSSLGRGSRRGTTESLNFANSNYAIQENIRSIVGEWNATLGTNMSNNLIAGYNSSDESRLNIQPPWFPLVEIREAGTNLTTFGFEPFTPANQLRYNNYQFQDNLTWYLRNHSLTFGLSYEKYHSDNVFFQGAQSVYVYNSLADFYTDANGYLANPSRTVSPVTLNLFQVRWPNIPGQTEPLQPLDVTYAGLYAQDEWRPTRNLTLVAGLRVDRPSFGQTAYPNAVADTMTFRDADGSPIQYSTGSLPDATLLFSPRIGFNYDVRGRQSTQVRGGTGVFTGRPAYVWISNQIGNTGVLTGFESIQNTTARPFNPDPTTYWQAATGLPASSFQLALVDPDFKFPQVWRSNFAVDQRLPWLGLTGTAEFLYSKDVNGIAYINANLPAAQSAYTGVDQRLRWVGPTGSCPAVQGSTANRLYNCVSDATVLTNQGRGSAWNLAFTLERSARNGLFGKAGYTYGESRNTVDPGSIAVGSFTGNRIYGDPNNPPIGYSQFSPGQRAFVALSYQRNFLSVGATTFSLFWEGRTSGNGSYGFSSDANGDGASNDLIYIPRNASEMNFEQYCVNATGVVQTNCGVAAVTDTFTVAEQQAAWEAFIQQDDYLRSRRGQYAQRNAVFLPMLYRTDVSISQEIGGMIGMRSHRLRVRLDILNFMNLLSSSSGQGYFMANSTPLVPRGADANGALLYRLRNNGTSLIPARSFDRTSGFNDVWRLQLGVRYLFN
jgi:hypothetical protein